MGAEAKDPKEQTDQNSASQEAEHREACDYWGYLIKQDKCGTELFDRLLLGIAEIISKKFEAVDIPTELQHDLADLTPSQIAAFYRSVGGNGNYDVLFQETPSSDIAFIFRSLGAFHSLQPAANADGYGSPTVPALKKQGFVMWQTIQLLLGPEEHVPFLQHAVANFDVVDPKTGNVFLKILPKECFPDRPDEAMESWYEGVAARLQREAAETERENVARPDAHHERPPRTSSEISGDSADERHGAAKYFEDPMYRKSRLSRPTIIRQFSKQPRPYPEENGRLVAHVRHFLNPFNRRKSTSAGRYEDDSFSDEDATPIATAPPRYSSHKRPHPPRREDSLTTSDSDSDSDRPPSRRRTPVLRRQRSHDPPTSPREYFPAYYDERRYSHDPLSENRKQDGPPPLYGPTKSPLFATHVAQVEARNYYNHRPSLAPRTSYRGSSSWYPGGTLSPGREVVDPPYVREYEPGSSSSSRSARPRSVDDYPRDRDRDRDRNDSARTRSHDRDREWDKRDRDRDRDRGRDRSWERDRDRDRERERERERERDRERGERDRERGDRDRRVHRYVAGVQDGVGGRRYPVEQPWR